MHTPHCDLKTHETKRRKKRPASLLTNHWRVPLLWLTFILRTIYLNETTNPSARALHIPILVIRNVSFSFLFYSVSLSLNLNLTVLKRVKRPLRRRKERRRSRREGEWKRKRRGEKSSHWLRSLTQYGSVFFVQQRRRTQNTNKTSSSGSGRG